MSSSLRFFATLFFALLFSLPVFAQRKYSLNDFYRVDSIAVLAKPKEALALIEKINAQAQKEHDSPLLIKSTIYRMMFQSNLEEDAFDAILQNLRESIKRAEQPEKSILQSLLAETYFNYLQQNRWQMSKRTKVQGDIGDDIKVWDINKLNDEIIKYYLLSVKETEQLQRTKLDVYESVLTGDKSNRSFRPTLYDLLAHRAINVLTISQIGLTQNDDELIDMGSPGWFGNRQTFLAMPLGNDSTSYKTQTLLLFKKLITFHQRNNNLTALSDVDLQRLKFVHSNYVGDNGELYYAALTNLAEQSAGTEVYADILFEQATMHKNERVAIDSNKQNLVTAVALAEKAISAYPKSMGAENAQSLISQIRRSELSIKIKEFIQPGKPAQLLFTHKNVDTIELKLFKETEAKSEYDEFKGKAEFLNYLKKKKVFRSWISVVPKTNDYQKHTLIDKVDGLPFGNYKLIAQTINRAQQDTVYSTINFTVTAMAANYRRNMDKLEYFVTRLSDGAPLKDVKIQQRRFDYNTRKYVAGALMVTDEKGYASTVESNRNMNSAAIVNGNDELNVNINSYYGYRGDDDEERVILFTDRPIYRPGQTIYYKGLCLATGNGTTKIAVGKLVDVDFNDANGKKIATKEVISNEFGTFKGDFTIPMGKLNGQMQIDTDYGSIYVQVEEYKRPTFEVVFNKPDQKYKLNDSIKVEGKANAFSGYAVNEAKVTYKIFRRAAYDYRLDYAKQLAIYGSKAFDRVQIAIGKTSTQKGGRFDITFFASATNVRQNYSYDIEVEVTDLNGETRATTTTINAGQKDINVSVSAEQVLFLSKNVDSIPFSVTNLNNALIKADVKAEWVLLQAPSRLTNKSPFYAEKYAMSREAFMADFPNEDYNNELEVSKWPAKSVALQQNLEVKNGKGYLTFSKKILRPGYYNIKLLAINKANDTVKVDKYVVVYNDQPAVIQSNIEWIAPEKITIQPTESADFRLAGLANNCKAYYEVYYRDSIAEKVWVDVSPKQSIIKITPKAYFSEGFAVQFTMVYQGTTYSSLQRVSIIDSARQLDVKFLSFRDKLQPGEKETWKLQISNKNGEKQMAEMVASLYDASLDDLKQMAWNTNLQTSFNYMYYSWNFNANNIANERYLWFLNVGGYTSFLTRDYEGLNLFGYNYFGGYNTGYRNYMSNLQRPKKGLVPEAEQKLKELEKGSAVYGVVFDEKGYVLPGVSVRSDKSVTTTNVFGIFSLDAKPNETLTCSYIGYKTSKIQVRNKKRIDIVLKEDDSALNEVVVVGYAAEKKKETTASIQIRGSSTLQGKVAGVQISADERKDPSLRQEVESLRRKTPEIVTRTNFNELAFFYPQLLTDENGEIKIEFTIPQSLTRYKLMGFVHTKDLRTAYVTKELITQKQLAIAINAPRFFREGDTISLSAKLNNLSGKKLMGNASLTLTDALTAKPLEIFAANNRADRTFEVDDEGNTALKWTVIIPSGVSAINYKVTAQSGKFTDGEENTIPVLPNAMLVTESMPISVRANTTKLFNFERLAKSAGSNTLRNHSLTFEFTSNPVWYAVQALPYLMEYPYECAEQTFSRFYANSFATGIINSSPKIKTVFTQWQNTNNGQSLLSNLEKNPELKAILLEETPWVRNADNETERKKRLAALFDLNRMTYEWKDNFEQLEKMQFNNGAFPWFAGMREDRYITQHIVLGMGQLKKLKLVDLAAYLNFNTMLNKAITYLDAKLVSDYKQEIAGKHFGYLPLHYLYARSYTDTKNANADFTKAKNFYVKKLTANWKTFGTYQLAQTALVLSRNGNNAEARKIIALLAQTAQQSDEMGMYWAINKVGWWWYQSPIETQALLIEAFDEVAGDAKAVEEMKIWLIKNKQTNDWQTTKATAAACYALLMKGTAILSENNEPEITIGNQTLAQLLPPNATQEAGTGYQKLTIAGANVKPDMANVTVKNNNKTIAWGAMYWQYFERMDKITPANTGVKIKKQLFLQKSTAMGDVLTPLTASNTLAPGDLLKVRIEIYCDRNMEYIHLKDMRSSGFEPVNVISRFKYQDGLGYYESTKDAATNFFINYLPKGTYVFEYPLRVTHSGNFSNGITTLQSMYAPEFTTHSEGVRVSVK
ncbi:alpha-2-macroglobulin family protein [Pedobacter endophyticus]|uniref:Carboxypeptidase-like regulatory domain-containing protein n=1 Tax=Pedobacter endophyticus TaxID=2789740 RepID=A0A7S9L2T7_9SPHI|nr:alpha-2-macroglobulin family protein [Pedobacter endophyticus]QPH41455.1 carboxypeptidase-like regulatory domain-containing protein [Pedobacter endophyticus]